MNNIIFENYIKTPTPSRFERVGVKKMWREPSQAMATT